MTFEGSPNLLSESYFTGEIRLGSPNLLENQDWGVLILESLNFLWHQMKCYLMSHMREKVSESIFNLIHNHLSNHPGTLKTVIFIFFITILTAIFFDKDLIKPHITFSNMGSNAPVLIPKFNILILILTFLYSYCFASNIKQI